MGFLYYLIGMIPICILAYPLIILVDKFKLKEKIQQFDNSNSGPVYDFLKTIFIILIFFTFICSIGVAIIPAYIWKAIESGNYIQAFFLSLLSAIIIVFDGNVMDNM